jgi:SsrA-binding protein
MGKGRKDKKKSGVREVVRNRKAWFDYIISDRWEAGIELLGAEVKSVRAGKVSIRESYATVQGDEVFIVNMDVVPYEHRGFVEYERKRRRKLLLHRREIRKIASKVQERGFTLVPLRLYFRNGFAKVEIGLAKGKTHRDKRQTLKERQARREMEREAARRRRR